MQLLQTAADVEGIQHTVYMRLLTDCRVKFIDNKENINRKWTKFIDWKVHSGKQVIQNSICLAQMLNRLSINKADYLYTYWIHRLSLYLWVDPYYTQRASTSDNVTHLIIPNTHYLILRTVSFLQSNTSVHPLNLLWIHPWILLVLLHHPLCIHHLWEDRK